MYYSCSYPKSTSYGKFERLLFEELKKLLNSQEVNLIELEKINAELEIFKGTSISLATTFIGAFQDLAYYLISSMPFGSKDRLFFWLHKQPLLKELFKHYDLIGFPMMIANSGGISWSNKEFSSQGLSKLKFSFYGPFSQFFKLLGAEEISLSLSQIPKNLESENIDFAQANNLSLDKELGIDEVADYLYIPSYHSSSTVSYLLIKENFWNSLSEEVQKKVEKLCSEFFYQSYINDCFDNETKIFKQLIRENKVRKVDPELEKKFVNFWYDLLWENQVKSELTSKVISSYYSFLDQREAFNFLSRTKETKSSRIGSKVIVNAYYYTGTSSLIKRLMKDKKLLSLNYFQNLLVLVAKEKKHLKDYFSTEPVFSTEALVINYPRAFGSIEAFYKKLKERGVTQNLILPCFNSQWVISTSNNKLASKILKENKSIFLGLNSSTSDKLAFSNAYLSLKLKENGSLERYLELLNEQIESIIVLDKFSIALVKQYSFEFWKDKLDYFEVKRAKVTEEIEKDQEFILSQKAELILL
jgi:TRAP-type mannitol/chloroaromatic compound transport system substrate-binding protein